MFRIYSTLIEMLAAAVFIVPIMVIYNRLFFHSRRRTVVYILFGLYFVAILALVGFPNIESRNIDFTINVIPFIDMTSDFVNACLNVILFVPFGFFLPILWRKYRDMKSSIMIGLLTSCIIEISQIFTFRTTDINDLITNTAGTIIGYCAARYLTNKFTKYIVSGSRDRDFYIISVSAGLVMFLLQPFVSSLLWKMVL